MKLLENSLIGLLFKKIIISFIIIYRHSFSFLFAPSCRFHPTCSIYMIESIKKHGVFLGAFYGSSRILRCNPFSSRSGLDPVE